MTLRKMLILATAALMPACTQEAGRHSSLLTGPSALPGGDGNGGALSADGPSAIDIGGTWNFTETVKAQIPVEVIEQFGLPIEPEGRVTHLTCHNSGVAQFVQTGSKLTGTQQGLVSECVTQGGQVLEGLFAGTFQITGQINGRSVHLEDPSANCPASLVISLQDGTATSMSGRAMCHDLLPGGVLNTVTTEYTRR
jgi:hypothetical protein